MTNDSPLDQRATVDTIVSRMRSAATDSVPRADPTVVATLIGALAGEHALRNDAAARPRVATHERRSAGFLARSIAGSTLAMPSLHGDTAFGLYVHYAQAARDGVPVYFDDRIADPCLPDDAVGAPPRAVCGVPIDLGADAIRDVAAHYAYALGYASAAMTRFAGSFPDTTLSTSLAFTELLPAIRNADTNSSLWSTLARQRHLAGQDIAARSDSDSTLHAFAAHLSNEPDNPFRFPRHQSALLSVIRDCAGLLHETQNHLVRFMIGWLAARCSAARKEWGTAGTVPDHLLALPVHDPALTLFGSACGALPGRDAIRAARAFNLAHGFAADALADRAASTAAEPTRSAFLAAARLADARAWHATHAAGGMRIIEVVWGITHPPGS